MDPHFAGRRLGPVRSDLLSADAIQRALARPAPSGLHLGDIGSASSASTVRPAAVLIALLEQAQTFSVRLTVRAQHLRDHAGQISFVGGAVDPGDADYVATALREAHEELAIPIESVAVLGCLPPYATVSGFVVHPVVARMPALIPCRPNHREVQSMFDVPLAFLMNDDNHDCRLAPTAEGSRPVYVMNHVANGQRYRIWGATAAMLRNFFLILKDAEGSLQSGLQTP
jgi:8-oxo-dGTP pyrophosphatase MutT (NUDIX family)